jgi:hypothetical protein
MSRTLTAPKLPNNLNSSVQWLAGEGAGSWFEISLEERFYRINRYSDLGVLECTNLFKTSKDFNLQAQYTITYPSHCARVTVVQNLNKFVFTCL